MSSLELIIGPMFSGKTSELIKIYQEKFSEKEKVMAINYDKDIRYEINKIVSHDGRSIPSINLNTLYEIDINFAEKNLFVESNWIFINEAQFFKDLKPWVLNNLQTTNKNFVLCGLDSDFKREKFGELLDLIPHADKLTKLYGTCRYCNNLSLYTHRISDEKEQEVIGNVNYVPTCRPCYIMVNK